MHDDLAVCYSVSRDSVMWFTVTVMSCGRGTIYERAMGLLLGFATLLRAELVTVLGHTAVVHAYKAMHDLRAHSTWGILHRTCIEKGILSYAVQYILFMW